MRKQLRKTAALFTSAAFFFQISPCQDIAFALSQPLPARELSTRWYELHPPTSLGRIVDFSFAPSSQPANEPSSQRLVILIQDLHVNAEVQKTIAKILEFYDAQGVLPPNVLIEGAQGLTDTTILASIKDPKLKEAACQRLLEEGDLTGMEYFMAQKGLSHSLYGVENRGYYKAHLELFRKSYAARESLSQELSSLQKALASLHDRRASRPLKKLASLKGDYASGKITLAEYFAKLEERSKEQNISLDQDFPALSHLRRLIAAEKEAKSLSAKQIRKATEAVVANLANRITPEEKDLLSKLAQRDPGLYYSYLDDLLRSYEPSNQRVNEPTFSSFLEYQRLSRQLPLAKADYQLERLYQKLSLNLAKTPLEKNLVSLSRDLDLSARMVSNQLTQEELFEIGPRLKAMPALIDSLAQADGITNLSLSDIDRSLQSALDFYAMALLRDRPMVEHALEKLDSVAIMVTGGFHTQGMADMLKEKGVSYIVLSPTVQSHSEEDADLYIRKLLDTDATNTLAAPAGEPGFLARSAAVVAASALALGGGNQAVSSAIADIDAAARVQSPALVTQAQPNSIANIVTGLSFSPESNSGTISYFNGATGLNDSISWKPAATPQARKKKKTKKTTKTKSKTKAKVKATPKDLGFSENLGADWERDPREIGNAWLDEGLDRKLTAFQAIIALALPTALALTGLLTGEQSVLMAAAPWASTSQARKKKKKVVGDKKGEDKTESNPPKQRKTPKPSLSPSDDSGEGFSFTIGIWAILTLALPAALALAGFLSPEHASSLFASASLGLGRRRDSHRNNLTIRLQDGIRTLKGTVYPQNDDGVDDPAKKPFSFTTEADEPGSVITRRSPIPLHKLNVIQQGKLNRSRELLLSVVAETVPPDPRIPSFYIELLGKFHEFLQRLNAADFVYTMRTIPMDSEGHPLFYDLVAAEELAEGHPTGKLVLFAPEEAAPESSAVQNPEFYLAALLKFWLSLDYLKGEGADKIKGPDEVSGAEFSVVKIEEDGRRVIRVILKDGKQIDLNVNNLIWGFPGKAAAPASPDSAAPVALAAASNDQELALRAIGDEASLGLMGMLNTKLTELKAKATPAAVAPGVVVPPAMPSTLSIRGFRTSTRGKGLSNLQITQGDGGDLLEGTFQPIGTNGEPTSLAYVFSLDAAEKPVLDSLELPKARRDPITLDAINADQLQQLEAQVTVLSGSIGKLLEQRSRLADRVPAFYFDIFAEFKRYLDNAEKGPSNLLPHVRVMRKPPTVTGSEKKLLFSDAEATLRIGEGTYVVPVLHWSENPETLTSFNNPDYLLHALMEIWLPAYFAANPLAVENILRNKKLEVVGTQKYSSATKEGQPPVIEVTIGPRVIPLGMHKLLVGKGSKARSSSSLDTYRAMVSAPSSKQDKALSFLGDIDGLGLQGLLRPFLPAQPIKKRPQRPIDSATAARGKVEQNLWIVNGKTLQGQVTELNPQGNPRGEIHYFGWLPSTTMFGVEDLEDMPGLKEEEPIKIKAPTVLESEHLGRRYIEVMEAVRQAIEHKAKDNLKVPMADSNPYKLDYYHILGEFLKFLSDNRFNAGEIRVFDTDGKLPEREGGAPLFYDLEVPDKTAPLGVRIILDNSKDRDTAITNPEYLMHALLEAWFPKYLMDNGITLPEGLTPHKILIGFGKQLRDLVDRDAVVFSGDGTAQDKLLMEIGDLSGIGLQGIVRKYFPDGNNQPRQLHFAIKVAAAVAFFASGLAALILAAMGSAGGETASLAISAFTLPRPKPLDMVEPKLESLTLRPPKVQELAQLDKTTRQLAEALRNAAPKDDSPLAGLLIALSSQVELYRLMSLENIRFSDNPLSDRSGQPVYGLTVKDKTAPEEQRVVLTPAGASDPRVVFAVLGRVILPVYWKSPQQNKKYPKLAGLTDEELLLGGKRLSPDLLALVEPHLSQAAEATQPAKPALPKWATDMLRATPIILLLAVGLFFLPQNFLSHAADNLSELTLLSGAAIPTVTLFSGNPGDGVSNLHVVPREDREFLEGWAYAQTNNGQPDRNDVYLFGDVTEAFKASRKGGDIAGVKMHSLNPIPFAVPDASDGKKFIVVRRAIRDAAIKALQDDNLPAWQSETLDRFWKNIFRIRTNVMEEGPSEPELGRPHFNDLIVDNRLILDSPASLDDPDKILQDILKLWVPIYLHSFSGIERQLKMPARDTTIKQLMETIQKHLPETMAEQKSAPAPEAPVESYWTIAILAAATALTLVSGASHDLLATTSAIHPKLAELASRQERDFLGILKNRINEMADLVKHGKLPAGLTFNLVCEDPNSSTVQALKEQVAQLNSAAATPVLHLKVREPIKDSSDKFQYRITEAYQNGWREGEINLGVLDTQYGLRIMHEPPVFYTLGFLFSHPAAEVHVFKGDQGQPLDITVGNIPITPATQFITNPDLHFAYSNEEVLATLEFLAGEGGPERQALPNPAILKKGSEGNVTTYSLIDQTQTKDTAATYWEHIGWHALNVPAQRPGKDRAAMEKERPSAESLRYGATITLAVVGLIAGLLVWGMGQTMPQTPTQLTQVVSDVVTNISNSPVHTASSLFTSFHKLFGDEGEKRAVPSKEAISFGKSAIDEAVAHVRGRHLPRGLTYNIIGFFSDPKIAESLEAYANEIKTAEAYAYQRQGRPLENLPLITLNVIRLGRHFNPEDEVKKRWERGEVNLAVLHPSQGIFVGGQPPVFYYLARLFQKYSSFTLYTTSDGKISFIYQNHQRAGLPSHPQTDPEVKLLNKLVLGYSWSELEATLQHMGSHDLLTGHSGRTPTITFNLNNLGEDMIRRAAEGHESYWSALRPLVASAPGRKALVNVGMLEPIAPGLVEMGIVSAAGRALERSRYPMVVFLAFLAFGRILQSSHQSNELESKLRNPLVAEAQAASMDPKQPELEAILNSVPGAPNRGELENVRRRIRGEAALGTQG